VPSGDRTVVSVDLATPNGLLTEATPAAGVTDVGVAPVEVRSITIDLDGPVTLVPRGDTADVSNLAFPPEVTGASAAENGAQTPAGTAAFEAAAERVFASADLRDYIRSDAQVPPGSDWGADYDVLFSAPLTTDDHLLMTERHGNAPFRLLALDTAGAPVEGAEPVEVNAPYAWNTGYAPTEQPDQPVHLSVVHVAAFAPAGSTIGGFRVDNDGEADINLTPLAPGLPAPVPTADPIPLPEPGPGPRASTADSGIVLTKTVYVGHDGGAGCDTAGTYTEASAATPVSYCFTVTNTGVDHLDTIALDDPMVEGEPVVLWADSTPLAPGDDARFLLETMPPADGADGSVDDTFTNLATVTATTVDAASQPTGPGTVTATAEAVVFPPEALPEPSVRLITTVYAGVDGGAGCPATDLTTVDEGAAVTYCFEVTNTGTTHLDPTELADPLVPGEPILLQADSTPLAPNDSALYYLDATAPALPPEGFTSRATVTANSVDASGADLTGLDDVTSSDGARITSAPEQLAFTGLETWLFALVGAGLLAGGWLLLHPEDHRRAFPGPAPAPMPPTAGGSEV
jgi:hypothetical protein